MLVQRIGATRFLRGAELGSVTPLDGSRNLGIRGWISCCGSLRGRWTRILASVQIYIHWYTLYMSVTDPINITEARKQLAAIIDLVRAEHEPVYLTRRGRRVAAVIDADDLAAIIDLAEDMADIRAAEAARVEMKETGEQPIPWEDVKAELGLT